MSLPAFSTQSELFSTTGLSSSLFPPTDPYRLFAQLVYPPLVGARPALESCYCLDNGRTALEPVLMLGVSILQHLEGVPDRKAVQMLRYHSGWNFALNRQLGDPVFDASSLVNFRHRMLEHGQSRLGFTTILAALEQAGLVSRQSRQRLDSTQIFGRVSKMNRLDCVRESLRLALQELAPKVAEPARPPWWGTLWERYVDSQADYQAGSETLARKLVEAGTDTWQLLEWVRRQAADLGQGEQVRLLDRVFNEQFEVRAGATAPQPTAKEPVPLAEPAAPPPQPGALSAPAEPVADPPVGVSGAAEALAQGPGESPVPAVAEPLSSLPAGPKPVVLDPAMSGPVQPKGKGQMASDRVQNPHDSEATYGVKGQGQQKKEHVGYKVQVAETVCEAVLAPGEPTRNFIVGMVTQPAYESDEAGALKMEQEQAAMGLEKPPVQYVDGAYISAQKLVEAQAEGRELIGPAQPAPHKDGRFTVEAFQVNVEERQALCPAGKLNTQCSRLEEETTGKVSYRFEFSTQCHDCSLRDQCLGKDQRHRTLVVGEHHSALQARRQEQQTEAFQQRMKHRNAIEGTQSELVRGHGLRQARYRGLDKVKQQNYLIGAACNVKRWIRREVWNRQQAGGRGQ